MRRNWLKLVYVAFIAGAFSLSACSGGGNKKKSGDIEIPDEIFGDDKPLMISQEAMGDIIDNISSPVEMAALLKSTGVPFSQKLLASTDRVDDLNTNFKQALNLGVYGCDLGYLNMYEKTGSVINNMTAIKSLANELRIGQFFDFNTIKRLATNNENLDSLMYISVSSFNNMDEYLRQTNRSNISSLIVTGMWVEGMYLATQVAKEAPNKEVVERIADQKLVLNDLILILKNYKADSNFDVLVKEIEKIKKEYEGVKITYEMGEPEAKEVDGMLIIVQNDKQHIDVSDETLNRIITSIEEVRHKIISM
ncbi:MAG: hypothetical protein A2W97_01780 [Bacteroidetes bacterium GWE2_40_63]|jgi:hypothetical protein|nr:MAG: hypothetical protein A2W95_16750 [Bacteroidetes bacterium GWA2_40_14]OFX62452.1 MAG: hypothetical protein A2W84_12700 [Bacteroidetes bacterium GWC2_40_13]OFX72260.1 MAG: hypothetical protein A2W96_17620 [Bacteroidetes bacterium GWD2_40_43]OFX90492.1 MAG: hypothetical protein A2W97_01780 [Bacteroidetes bacterium GWE2_40_63]OFY17262.1 MAG: hypothetical protein A2W88_15085 [Bacteroidetes bacterium GWF2_40_13]OFZ29094.1 MAG: hypothetical protein A2437_16050 [Bacteroidetes bacterium RIFOXYC